jgi:hypothetical protein
MHKSRIINSVNPKIMINSQDVQFDITRQCAQVELKNINIFNKKDHLGSFGNFWHNNYSYSNTQHIQNWGTEELWISSYDRSMFFTFVFFMLKLFRIQPCANNKSDGISFPEPSKIGFAFFRFFYEFLGILQDTGLNCKKSYIRIFTTKPCNLRETP